MMPYWVKDWSVLLLCALLVAAPAVAILWYGTTPR